MSLFLISCYHIQIRFLCHMLYNLRILLQIRINDGQICSGCIMKSCINSGFFSKISGKVYDKNVAVLFMQVLQFFISVILAAIVYENHLKLCGLKYL